MATPQHQASGWHVVEWGCECLGTAFQLFLGFCAIALFESPRSGLSHALPEAVRLVALGLVFGGLAAVVALSPIGRRSGAHLNPAVTFGFFLQGHTSWRDTLGYAAGQFLGATVAAVGFAALPDGWAASVHDAQTLPAPGLAPWAVALIEAALTCGLLLTIFGMLSSHRSVRWTPMVVTGVLGFLIWAGAPSTGASLNPARTFGPDVVVHQFASYWAYTAGPLLGAAVAVVLYRFLAQERQTLTAKLFHDARYPSVHATTLPAKPLPSAAGVPPA